MTRLSDNMEKQAKLLSTKLLHNHRQVEVILNRSVLAWKVTEKSGKRSSGVTEGAHSHTVQVFEIVAVHKTEDDDTQTRKHQEKTKQHSQLNTYAFTVSYVRRTRQHRWRCSDVTFHCASRELCEQWIQVTNEQLLLLTNRPKSLLVYINPYGGKRRGKHIYEQKVAPMFRRAGISADVIVTERANHARDHLKTEANLDKYDGVVCVGGDGMFSEILHGLVSRTQMDHGVDQNQPDAELVPCSLRIGIIPAGSTDCICFATVGTNDPVTSALHIIVGDSQPIDVCSVHHDDIFLRYSVSLLGYGFYGDVLTDSERNRWLGPARYDLSGVKTFLSHNYYEGAVSFLPAADDSVGSPRDKLQCRSGCRICQHKSPSKASLTSEEEEEEEKSEGSSGWKVIHGKFIAINAANMSCACPRSPKGLSPSAHLADGTTDLILVRKCSRLDFFKHLLRHTNKDDQFDHSFVEVHRVRKFHFQPRHREPLSLEDLSEPLKKKTAFRPMCSAQTTCSYNTAHSSSWSCDGEILHHSAIQVSVQCQLIRLFARGIEEQQQQQQQQCVFEDPNTLWTPEPSTEMDRIFSY
ncbi:ceramide kinase [Parambassis ranga]|uniref:Ceramide kinase n=1 Tax=Parambassis ranga TaxID=210632 RepID=A0A6P7HRF0_9TELE|nr:ceramide kinase [Parambassis ranga]